MNPSNTNAFRNTTPRADGAASSKRLAGLLAPMRARVRETVCGWGLELEPMRAVDALVPWATFAGDAEASTLLLAPGPKETDDAGPLATVATRMGIDVAATLGPDRIVMDADPLRSLVGLTPCDGLVAVLIEGPVEDGDAAAIESGLTQRQSPLQAEIRAVAALRVVRDRAVFVEARTRHALAAIVAENFRHYLAAVLDRSAAGIATPEVDLIDRLLERSGSVTVRPIETETYSTAVDIGVSSSTDGTPGPADASIVYDRSANTWHGD